MVDIMGGSPIHVGIPLEKIAIIADVGTGTGYIETTSYSYTGLF
jgi:hypothetical protein